MGPYRNEIPQERITAYRPGRKPIHAARQILEGVLWILSARSQRQTLPQCCPNCIWMHRRFRQWCHEDIWREVTSDLAKALREEGGLVESERFIDDASSSARGGETGISKTQRGKDLKTVAIVDRHGLPLALSTRSTNHNKVTPVKPNFDAHMVEAQPDDLLGNKAYGSGQDDAELRRQRIEIIAPRRSNRKKRKQDRRRLRRYERCWLAERFFARTQ